MVAAVALERSWKNTRTLFKVAKNMMHQRGKATAHVEKERKRSSLYLICFFLV